MATNSSSTGGIRRAEIKPQMQITWYGQSCFKIQSGDTTVVLGPFDKEIGINPPRGKADIVLLSSDLPDAAEKFSDAGFVISGAGEYEIKEIMINGFSFFNESRKSTVYTISIEGVSICSLDNAGKQDIEGLLEKLGGVDILLVPVGGSYQIGKEKFSALDAESAVKIVSEIEPRLVIPMNFKIPKLNIDLEGPEKFLKAIGSPDIEAIDKLTIKKKDLPQEETKVILLKTNV